MAVADFLTRALIIIGGMLFPGYKSFKAVKKADVAEQQRMLKYWLVLSILSAIMLVIEPFLSTRVPVYNVFKIAFIGFLVHPKTAGFEKVYDVVVQPVLDQHMATIDDSLDKLAKAADDGTRNFVPTVTAYGQKVRDMATQRVNKKAS